MSLELKETRDGWDQQNGTTLTYVYEGHAAEYTTWLAGMPNGYVKLERTLSDGQQWVQVSITYGNVKNDEPPIPGESNYGLISGPNWELQQVDDQVPLCDHENVSTLAGRWVYWPSYIQLAVAAFKAKYQEWTESVLTGDNTMTEPTFRMPTPPTGATTTEKALALAYAIELLRDENATFELTRWVLRVSRIVTNVSTLKASHANANRVMTYGALVRSESTLDAATLLDPAGLRNVGVWHKKPPTARFVQGGNVEIAQEWHWWAVYSEFRYGALIQ